MPGRTRHGAVFMLLFTWLASCAEVPSDRGADREVLEGELTVLAALVRPGESLEYHLRTDAGDIFILDFAAPPDVEANSRVSVVGRALDADRFHVESIEQLTASRDIGMIRQALGSSWSTTTAAV